MAKRESLYRELSSKVLPATLSRVFSSIGGGSSSPTYNLVESSAAFNAGAYGPGLFDLFGTKWGAVARTASTDLGGITLTSTYGPYGSRTASSYPLSAATDGNDSTLAITSIGVNGDIIWDFGEHQTVTVENGYYLLGRGDSNHDEMRNWKLQGSSDRTTWVDIDVRVSDTTMSGVSWTPYAFSERLSYTGRYLRLLMTGNTASDTPFMPIFGLEVYGSTIDVQPNIGAFIDATYRTGSNGGVFEWLGTLGGTRAWVHPESCGMVVCAASSKYNVSYGPQNVIQTTSGTAVSIVTPSSGSYWEFDFGEFKSVRPERYRIGNRTDNHDSILSWSLEASVDGSTWVTISDQTAKIVENRSTETGGTYVLSCECSDAFYRYFRLTPTDWVSASDIGLYAFEIYGVMQDVTPALDVGATRILPAGLITALDGIIQTLGTVTATASSSVVGSAASAIDGNLGTGWVSSSSAGNSLQLDFGAGNSILPYIMGMRGRVDSNDQHPKNFIVEHSDNGSTWTTALTPDPTVVEARWLNGAFMPFFFDQSTGFHRYWQIRSTGLNCSGADYLSIGEVEFWGDLHLLAK